MTDRELLEAAARAAGDVTHEEVWKGEFSHFERNGVCWNPLTSDGDSRRLEVALRMEVSVGDDSTTVTDQTGAIEVIEPHNGDACAATRLAVLKCAAAIADSPMP